MALALIDEQGPCRAVTAKPGERDPERLDDPGNRAEPGELGYADAGSVAGVFTATEPFPVRIDLDALV